MLKEENMSKRECQSVALLEKLIRLDSKDCNFHFKDDYRAAHFKVAYPQTNTDNKSNEGLLRQLWHHIWAHYFKKPEHEELRRLDYARAVFGGRQKASPGQQLSHAAFPVSDSEFLRLMDDVYSTSYQQTLSSELESDRETQLWVKELYLNVKIAKLSEWLGKQERKKSKIIYSKLKQNRKHRRRIKAKKALNRAIEEDQQAVQEFLEELQGIEEQHGSEIDREIARLEKQMARNSQESLEVLQGLEQRMKEAEENESRGYYRNFMYNGNESTLNNSKDLQCLEYLIRCLQEKQIAESVSKIISTQRSSGEILFQITYEKAINVDPKLINQKELARINFLRETSLVNFYRTGVKSPYSYICHNVIHFVIQYVGFRELMQNRLNITAKLKDKCMIQMMKKGACLASIQEIQQEMARFNMCHHCKFLYPDYLLFTCKFASDKQAIPKYNIQAVCDPNLSETYQEGSNKNRTSQRFMTRKRNCLTSYAKIHDEFVCGRKYCFSCLKDSYSHENIRENGLCPFCLGVCICTRCLRNEKIAKFKNMYSMLGGDVAKMQDGSDLEQMQAKCEEVVQRGRGRPKKYATHITVNVVQKKLRKFDEKENYVFPASLMAKKKRKTHIYNIWKRNDSGNDTQQQLDPKRKKKRGVGRPRNDRKIMQLQ